MKSKDFLRSKGILSNDADHFIIYFHDGREINLAGLLEEYAQQSQPSGMRWVREKPANDREFVLVTASLINGEWHYHGWEIIEVPDGYFALCELHGEEWGPYEDLSAEYYLVLSPVSESSPAGAAEGIKCKCPDNIKHGQTSVMCCNHCGLPDEDFWNNCG